MPPPLSLGSYMNAAQKSYSLVQGGQAREAAKLAWHSGGERPPKAAYDDWTQSVIQNPVVVDYKVWTGFIYTAPVERHTFSFNGRRRCVQTFDWCSILEWK